MTNFWRHIAVGGGLILLALFLTIFLPRPGVSAADEDEAPFQACFVELAPRGDTDAQSDVLSEDCFTDEKEAEAFRTELESFDGVFVLFTIWQDTNFGGSWFEWYSETSCSGDYGVNDFNPIGWNDRASSARAACGRTIALWEHTFQSGASLNISGWQSSLGVLGDESSSWDTAD